MPNKPSIIAFANNKGGSGKTTAVANLAYSLSEMGKKVLAVDADMQMNLTLSFFDEEKVMELASGKNNIYYGITEAKSLTDCIVKTKYKGLDVVPSSSLMSMMEYNLYSVKNRERCLKDALSEIVSKGVYDYILIDSPPTLGSWVLNILVASDSVVMPVEASPWGLFGVANMFDFLEDAGKYNKDLKLLGILITKVNTRKNYYKQTVFNLQNTPDVRVFDTIIRIDSEVEWAQDNSMPVRAYKKTARSGLEYMELAKEVDRLCR